MGNGFPKEARDIMDERFGCDTLLSLATADDGVPHVRTVNSYYEDNGEYVTQGYFAARNLHFYVVARNGQRTQLASDILDIIAK